MQVALTSSIPHPDLAWLACSRQLPAVFDFGRSIRGGSRAWRFAPPRREQNQAVGRPIAGGSEPADECAAEHTEIFTSGHPSGFILARINLNMLEDDISYVQPISREDTATEFAANRR